jgi:Flp pilus assembly protein TadG
MTRRAARSGAAAVDFAIIGSVFIALLLLAMETGWQLVIDAALGAGARAAARFGTTGAVVATGITPPPPDRDTSILQVAVRNSGGLLVSDRLQFTAASYANFAALAGGGASTAGPGSGTQVVRYTFTYRQPYLTPIAIAITGNPQMVHTVQVTVLNEPFPSS